jgi:hypothetical protein
VLPGGSQPARLTHHHLRRERKMRPSLTFDCASRHTVTRGSGYRVFLHEVRDVAPFKVHVSSWNKIEIFKLTINRCPVLFDTPNAPDALYTWRAAEITPPPLPLAI